MALLKCENGDYFVLNNFQALNLLQNSYTPDVRFHVYVKSGAFAGAAEMDSSVLELQQLYSELSEMCETYTGKTTLIHNDYFINTETHIDFAFHARGYLNITGVIEDTRNRLTFQVKAAVGDMDDFLQQLKQEQDI